MILTYNIKTRFDQQGSRRGFVIFKQPATKQNPTLSE